MANPIAAWALDEGTGTTAADATGNGHTLALTSATWTAGHTGNALTNTGSTVGALATVPAVTGACTLMAWIKPLDLAAGTTHFALGAVQASGNTDFVIYTQRGDFGTHNVLQATLRIGGGPVAVAGPALTVGTWYHIAVTFDGTNAKLYVNGTLVTTTPNTGTLNNSTSFYVAGSNSGTGADTDVVVDDPRYFSTDESANITTWMNTPVSSGAGSVTGTAAASFGGLTGAATGVVADSGVATGSFGGLTGLLAGTRSLTGSAAAALGGLSGSADGTRATDGSASATLGGLTGALTGIVADSGVAVGPFGGLTGSLTGVRGTDGAAAADFGGLTGTMTAGGRNVSGSAGAAFGGLAGDATADRTVLGRAELDGGPFSGNLSDGSTQHHPSSSLVMLAWLRQIAGVPASVTLPNPAKWFDTGMTTITPVGGNPNIYVPERAPVFQVDCWAVNPAAAGAKTVSRKIPRGKANELADIVVMATYALSVPAVSLPAQYLPVWIESAVPISEVREIPEPDNSYAHYSVDVQLRWTERAPAVNL